MIPEKKNQIVERIHEILPISLTYTFIVVKDSMMEKEMKSWSPITAGM